MLARVELNMGHTNTAKELFNKAEELRNQCDGCKRGLPIVDGIHIDETKKGFERLYMVCEKSKYCDLPY